MLRRVLPLACLLCCVALLHSASGQQTGDKKPVRLRISLPQEDAELTIDGKATKQTGVKREFVSPPVEAKGKYAYNLVVVWEPNNYTTITRTRKVWVRAGEEVDVDLTKDDPENPDRFLIRYVPTPNEVVEAMCKLGGVVKGDVVYDLGCGDGRIVITAVKKFGAKRGVGVDIDPLLVKESKANAKKEGVSDKVEFRQSDVLDLKDLGDANVVMLYMGEDVNLRLRPLLKKSLKPGSRVVSHDFGMGDWKPDQKIVFKDNAGDEHELYLWKIGKQE